MHSFFWCLVCDFHGHREREKVIQYNETAQQQQQQQTDRNLFLNNHTRIKLENFSHQYHHHQHICTFNWNDFLQMLFRNSFDCSLCKIVKFSLFLSTSNFKTFWPVLWLNLMIQSEPRNEISNRLNELTLAHEGLSECENYDNELFFFFFCFVLCILKWAAFYCMDESAVKVN